MTIELSDADGDISKDAPSDPDPLPETYDTSQDTIIDYTDFLVELRDRLFSTAELQTVYEGPLYDQNEGLSSVLVENLYDNYDIGNFDGEIYFARRLLQFLDNGCPEIGEQNV